MKRSSKSITLTTESEQKTDRRFAKMKANLWILKVYVVFATSVSFVTQQSLAIQHCNRSSCARRLYAKRLKKTAELSRVELPPTARWGRSNRRFSPLNRSSILKTISKVKQQQALLSRKDNFCLFVFSDSEAERHKKAMKSEKERLSFRFSFKCNWKENT